MPFSQYKRVSVASGKGMEMSRFAHSGAHDRVSVAILVAVIEQHGGHQQMPGV